MKDEDKTKDELIQELIELRLKSKAQDRLDIAMSSLKCGIYDWNVISNKIHWDKNFQLLIGSVSESEKFSFKDWENGIHPEDKERVLKEIEDFLKMNSELYTTEYRFKRMDGEWIWVSDHGIITEKDENNKPIRMIGFIWDINEKKELQINALNADKEKSIFLGKMAHEIRTPLNGIVGCCNLLGNQEIDEKTQEYIKLIQLSSERLTKTMTEILDYSKIRSSLMEVNDSEFVIIEFLNRVKLRLNNIFFQNNNHLDINIDTDVPNRIITDPTILERILINLMSFSNFKTHNGAIKISISLISKDNSNSILELSILDNGVGVETKDIPNFFEPFCVPIDSLEEGYEGISLGLPIVKELVNILGGDIKIQSVFGEGTKIIFKIDTKTCYGNNTVIPLNEKEQKDQGAEIKNLAKEIPLRILIVDDDRISLTTESLLLQEFGYDSDLAENGQVAIEKARKNNYDLILMDIRMPVINGIDTSIEIFKINSEKRPLIIPVTADLSMQGEIKCKNAGMSYFLTKPFDSKKLYKLIIKEFKK